MAKLNVETSIRMIPKEKELELCTGLSHDEFKCRCNNPRCDYTLISPLLLKSYQDLREYYGKPLTINSGFRCRSHNKAVGGSENSSHAKGLAIDISLNGIGTVERTVLINLGTKLFSYTREYDNFFHLQINPQF